MILDPRELIEAGKLIATEFAYVVLYDAQDFIEDAIKWLDKAQGSSK